MSNFAPDTVAPTDETSSALTIMTRAILGYALKGVLELAPPNTAPTSRRMMNCWGLSRQFIHMLLYSQIIPFFRSSATRPFRYLPDPLLSFYSTGANTCDTLAVVSPTSARLVRFKRRPWVPLLACTLYNLAHGRPQPHSKAAYRCTPSIGLLVFMRHL